MGFAVVDPGTGQGRVDFTGAVPGGAQGAEARSAGLIALLFEPFGDAAGGPAEIGHHLVDQLVFAKAEHAVAERKCVAADFVFLFRHFALPFLYHYSVFE